jgi:uroporphyrinogen-III synthase
MLKLRRCSALQKKPSPLHGVRVLVTRAPDQSVHLVRLLEEQGAHVAVVPLIRIGPPPNERELQHAVDAADAYDWLVFTSAAGVDAFARRLRHPLKQAQSIAVVGAATGRALTESLDRKADLIPEIYSSSALADAIVRHTKTPQSILVVAAQDASPVLAAKLRSAGHRVTKVDAYTTVENVPADLESHISGSDVITLASPSAVRALVRGLGEDLAAAKLRGKLVACIGPITLFEARERGLHVEVTPESATFPALVDALCRYYSTPQV